ncbi:uncharacterized protein LOC132585443 [Heteronotia binoei]|uniref:uncharacterized protein LOC132585443 n=1 Tax=Heteronotia binoei TaxID=13085 RepID=UPI00292CA6D7|nr:uncharacterized protein LOC132585443 [Heteronotia binoei]
MDLLDPVSLLLLFVLSVAFFLKTGNFWNTSKENLPPGPRPWPLVGNLHLVDLARPYRTMSQLSKQYGPVFSFQLGSQKMVVLTGYETVKEALVNQADAFAERAMVPMFEEFAKGYGVIFAHGENWKVMRRFMLSTLRDYGMGKRTIEDKIVEECHFLKQKLESYKGKPFETTVIMNAAVANIIVSILLGKRYEYEDPTFVRLLNLVSENVRLLGSPSVTLCNMFPALGFLSGGRKTVLQNRKEMHAFIQATFIEHLKELDVNDQRSFIDAFLIRQQEEKNKNQMNGFFHNENLKSSVGNLFAAGMETTSTTLRWGLLLLMKYPEVQKTVQEEITKVIGSAQPQTEHRSKLPYTDAVIHEVQRFANILPMGLPHATTADVTLKGYFIPKGTHILPLLHSVLYDESQWEKPLQFYPGHFLDSEGKFVKRDAFLPFSAGRRICVGETLAKMELFLFFVSLLQRFTFQPAPGMSKEDLDLTPAVGATTPPMPYRFCALPHSAFPPPSSASFHVVSQTNFCFFSPNCTTISAVMDLLDPVSLLLLFVLSVAFFLKMGNFWSTSKENLPPGPRPWPLFGNLHLLDLKRPYRTMTQLSKQYGPVFSFQMGSQKMVVLTGYETVKEALVNQADAFAERAMVPMFEEFAKGYGIVFAHGENWKVMRRFLLTTLRDYGMGKRTIEDKIVEECHFLKQKFESYKGKPFETTVTMNAAVANIIVSILLGKRYEYEDPTFVRLLNLVNENVRLIGSPSVMLYNMFPALGFLSAGRRTVLGNVKEMHAFIQDTFIEHLKELDVNDQRSLIDTFLIQQQEEKSKNQMNEFYHNENLKVSVGNLFAAGMETTSTTLRWGLLLMMKYPEIQNKVQEEITKVIGSAQPQTEHRSKLPYTDAVIHEVQRFANILPMGLPHATTVDVTLKGYFIPKGTYILPLLYSVLYDESQWEKPLQFYPGHFLDSEGKFVKRDAFLPFSAGRRICIGETLAKMELFLFFTSLLQRFTFQPAPGMSKEDLDLTPAVGATTPPKPFSFCALPRS